MFVILGRKHAPPRLATILATCGVCQEPATSTTVSAEQADRLLATAPQVDAPPVADVALAGSSAA